MVFSGFMHFEMSIDETDTQDHILTNVGEPESILNYQIGVAPFSDVGGGPDQEGMTWTDSDLETNLDYEWIEISDTGNLISFADNDDAEGPFEVGFDFPFFESQYSQCVINPNGWVGFGSNNSGWDNTELPNTSAPRPAIMAMWDDLNPQNNNGNIAASGNAYYYRDPAGDYFVVWYDDVVRWQGTANPNSGEFDFQVVIYRDGRFDLNYREMIGDVGSATIGYQNASGNAGTMIAYNQNFIQNNQSIFIAKATTPEWLTVGTQTGEMSGLLPGGQSFDISLMVNTNGLSAGSYYSMLRFESL